MFTIINLTKKTVAELQRTKQAHHTSDLLLISFLIPVIALSGVNLKPVMIPAELMLGALDGP